MAEQVLVRGYAARVDFWALLRTMGLAFTPVALSVFIVFDVVAIPIGVFAFGGAVLLSNAAIQSAADVDFREALIANIAGLGVFLTVMAIWSNVEEVESFGGVAPGILFFSLDL